ncbi:MAG: hypothetical protein ACRD4V_01930, partial [Candidatus Acidiferrales bacterium]
FGVVAFTIIVQGITMKPLVRLFGIATKDEDEYSRARVQQIAITSSLSELEGMAAKHMISGPVYRQLRQELEDRLQNVTHEVDTIFSENHQRLAGEFHSARTRLLAAEKSAIEQAFHDGLLTASTASKMADEASSRYEEHDEPPAKSAVETTG